MFENKAAFLPKIHPFLNSLITSFYASMGVYLDNFTQCDKEGPEEESCMLIVAPAVTRGGRGCGESPWDQSLVPQGWMRDVLALHLVVTSTKLLNLEACRT